MWNRWMFLLTGILFALAGSTVFTREQALSLKNQPALSDPVKISVIYDNYEATAGTKTDWGFSCLVEGTQKTILFDAGANPDIWLHNVAQLKLDVSKIMQIVISHDHGDHTGGLAPALSRAGGASVVLLSAFSRDLHDTVQKAGVQTIIADEPQELCRNVFVTGVMGTQIKEQALVIFAGRGLAVITGCAHPGIVPMLKAIKERFSRDIWLVLGGFHLMNHSEAQVKDIIGQLKALGVTDCGATHCTGDKAIALFKEAFGAGYVSLGTGRVLQITTAGVK